MIRCNMATRNPTNMKDVVPDGTCFQLHKSQLAIFDGIQDKVIDFTEYKLTKYAESVTDSQQHAVLMSLINDYRKGNVAISWRKNRPVWVSVTKDT